MMLDGKRILITGVSGFVGAVLLRRILFKHPKAKPFVILRQNANTWRIKDVLDRVRVLEVDLTQGEKFKKEVLKLKQAK